MGDASLSFHHEDGRLELKILKRDVARYFAGDLVRELYLEVQRLAVRTEPEFLEDLRKL